MKPAVKGWIKKLVGAFKKMYLVNLKGVNPDTLVLTTLVFEGTRKEVKKEQQITFSIANKHGGIISGEENGKNGFNSTFVITYLRDFCLEYNIMGESFETAVHWSKIKDLVTNVKQRIIDEVAKAGSLYPPFCSFRIT